MLITSSSITSSFVPAPVVLVIDGAVLEFESPVTPPMLRGDVNLGGGDTVDEKEADDDDEPRLGIDPFARSLS